MTDGWLTLAAALAVQAGAPGEPVQALGPDRVRLLGGPLAERQELHRTGLLRSLAPDRLLVPYRRCAGLPQPAGVTAGYGGWDDQFIAGHYGAHYLTAAARMWAATGDELLRDRANAMVAVLAECQRALGGGYLAGFPATSFDKLEADPHQGSVQYYTIHKVLAGLLDVHTFCGNAQALTVAERMADYFAARLAHLAPAQLEVLFRTDYTANPHNEFGGIAEALVDLYVAARAAGDAQADRHLRLAALFCRDWLIDPLAAGEDRLDGLHGNTHLAQVSGLARYAVVTGDARLGQAAETFWRLLTERHSFANGGNGFNEKLRAAGTEVAGTGPAALGPQTAESCNTNNLLKLGRHLQERQPRVALGDAMENALYNHLLATIAPDTGRVTYFTPLRPGDYRTYLDAPYCCQASGLENTARFGEAMAFARGDALWLNLYADAAIDWREQGLVLRVDTEYPLDGRVAITLSAPRPVEATLHLRLPGWLTAPVSATVNGAPGAAAQPGAWLSLRRAWAEGDCVAFTLPLAPRVRPALDDPRTVSFFHGPLLLAGELGCEGMPASDVGDKDATAELQAWPTPYLAASAAATLTPVPGQPAVYEAELVGADGQPCRVRLAPLYTVHHQRYAVYWTPRA